MDKEKKIESRKQRPHFSVSESSDSSCVTVDTQFTDLESDEHRDSVTSLLQHSRSTAMFRTPSCVSGFPKCENQQKLDDLFKSYTKLKIYFCVLCIVNVVIILLVCIFFAVFFIRFSDQSDSDRDKILVTSPPISDKLVPPQPTSFKQDRQIDFPIKCSTLKYRLNATSYADKDKCSLEDLVDAIAKYLKPRAYNEVLHLFGGEPDKHKSVVKTEPPSGFVNMKWEREKDSGEVVTYAKSKGTIVIPSSGHYYVYSRVSFKFTVPDDPGTRYKLNAINLKHQISRKRSRSPDFERIQSTSVKCHMSNNSFVHNTYLQRVVYLEAGDELKVLISDTGEKQFDKGNKDENYFGVFKL